MTIIDYDYKLKLNCPTINPQKVLKHPPIISVGLFYKKKKSNDLNT